MSHAIVLAQHDSETEYTGVMHRHFQEKFGFVRSSGGVDMFVMPGSSASFAGKLPPIGTRVKYKVVMDSKTGKLRAGDLEPIHEPPVKTLWSIGTCRC